MKYLISYKLYESREAFKTKPPILGNLIVNFLTKDDLNELLIPLSDIVGEFKVDIHSMGTSYHISSVTLKDMDRGRMKMNDYYIGIFDELKELSIRLDKMYNCELSFLFVNDRLNMGISINKNI